MEKSAEGDEEKVQGFTAEVPYPRPSESLYAALCRLRPKGPRVFPKPNLCTARLGW